MEKITDDLQQRKIEINVLSKHTVVLLSGVHGAAPRGRF